MRPPIKSIIFNASQLIVLSTYCLTVLVCLVSLVLLGFGIIELSNTAIVALGGVTYRMINLMKTLFITISSEKR